MKHWFLAMRIKTLTASVAPVFLAGALVFKDQQSLDVGLFLSALFAGLFAQVGVNFFNDALDFKKGSDTKNRLGPKRMTQNGFISSNKMLKSGFASFLLAAIVAIPLLMQNYFVVSCIGLFCFFIGYIYSGSSFSLSRHGLGEITVIFVFGSIALMATYYTQTLNVSLDSLIASLQVGFLAAVLIAINNLRDIQEDKSTHKKTLAVIYGKTFARYSICILFLCSYILGFHWLLKDNFLAMTLPLITLPATIFLIYKIFTTEPSSQYNIFLSQSAAIHFVFSLLLATGFIL